MTDTPTKRRHRTGAGARFNPDAYLIYQAVNIGVLLVTVAAVLVSWQGLISVAAWMLIPQQWAWIVPVMLDITIVTFTVGILPRRARGESTWLMALGAYGLTGISAAANFTHVMLESPADTAPLQLYAGASLAGLAPMLILLTTEVLASLITRPPAADNPRAKVKRQADEVKAQKATIRKLTKDLEAAEKRAIPTRITTKAVGDLSVRTEVPLVSQATVDEVEQALSQPYPGDAQEVPTWATKSVPTGVNA